MPAAWLATWAARPEFAPRTLSIWCITATRRIARHFRQHQWPPSMSGWEYRAPGSVKPGKWYCSHLTIARKGGPGRPAGKWSRASTGPRPDGTRPGSRLRFTQPNGPESGRVFSLDAPASGGRCFPSSLQLHLQNAPYATIWWDEISLEEMCSAWSPYRARVPSSAGPRDTHSAEQSVNEFLGVISKSVSSADVILLARRDSPWLANGKTLRPTWRNPFLVRPRSAWAKLRAKKMRNSWPHLRARGRRDFITPPSHRPHRRFNGKYRKCTSTRRDSKAGFDAAIDYPGFPHPISAKWA